MKSLAFTALFLIIASAGTHHPSEAFLAPFIKNRVATATDARAILTRYAYDDRGNPITVERGGVTTHDAYAVNGDRTSHTDGEGQVWPFRYDTYGQLTETESPLRDVSASTYDRRGRRLTQTDANGNTTRWTYDARDRVLTTALPGGANETRAYTDSARTVTITNPRGVITRQEFDLMGRLERETVADDTRTRDYDKNGNLVAETDFGGHATTYVYDAVNRLEYTRQAGDDGTLRTTHVTYDALGHVLSETIGAGATGDGDARRTEYRYEHPSYARTLVRRELIDDSGSRWLEDSTTYDANGNPRLSRDAEGRVTERTFDDRDRLITEAGPLGRTTTLTYDGRDLKRSQRRSNAGGSGAQVREWRYDAAGRLQDSVDAEGGVRSQTYDGVGNVTSRSDARGNTVRYRYDARNNVIEERGPAPDQFTSYGYDANNNRTRETFANGRELSHSYDGRDRRHVSSDGDGHVETRTWTPDGLPDTVTDADGRVTRSFHDALHRLVREELPGPGQRRRTYGHTIHGDVERITDALGRVTRQEYDSLGRRTATTYPAVAGETAVTRTRYDAVGNVVAEVNGRGQTTTYEVNALNRRTAQVDPLPCEAGGSGTCRQTWTYDTEGNVLTHTDRRGVLSVSAYDRENRLVGQARDGLVVQTLEHDAQGNVIAQWDALSRETRFTYDTANRKTQTLTANRAREDWTYTPLGDIATHTDADRRTTAYTYTKRRYLESESLAGETTRYTYDGAGHQLSRQRPTGEAATWRYTYDTAGRLQTVQDPLANTTTFGYDSVDNRTQVTDANQRTTVFTYDARNRLTGKTYPGGGSWTWTYDADSNRTASEAPNGRVTQTTYDALSRPTLSTYVAAPAGEVQTTAWAYDGNGNLRRVAETTDGTTRTETRTYDPFDRLTDVTNGDGRHLTYRYDDVGNRTELTDHDGQTTVWSYDDLNHNTAISLPGLGITRQTHTAAGRLESITRPDGAESIYTYNDTGRLETLLHRKAGQPIASYTYRYDPNGNRLIQEESNGPVSANTTQLTRYTYDDADRLTQVDEPGRTTVYTLDPVGNREHERVTDGTGTLLSDSTLTYNPRDQLTNRDDPIAGIQLTQTWDNNGNLATQIVNGGTPRVYTYDARDRMKALSLGNGTTLYFTYHADGLRREKTDGTTTTRYQYDGQSLLAETNAIGNTLTQYHYSAEQLLAETKAGTTPQRRQYLLDALRSPIALLTAEGAVSARTSYDAFGEVRAQVGTTGTLVTPDRDAANAELPSADGQAVGFTGYIKDNESGLYYAKARYYDPATARFNTEDPEAGKDLEPPSLHRYLYAYANPTVYLDSDGRQACRGHEVENCPLPQWTSPNRPIPQTTARNALRGDPHLTEVNADRAFALPTVSLTPDEHINTELYRLVPHVDPKDDNKAVRFYSAQNRETGQFDWTVPPDALDYFVKHESYQMNMAAYSRTMGGATPSNIEVQRAHREIASGNITGAMSHLTSSWGAALKDPLFYLTALGGMTAGSAAKAVEPARAITIAEGGGSRPVVRRTAADFAGHADSEAGGAPSPFRRVTPTKDRDEGAQAFAKKHGGQASVNIEGFSNREFDMVSDQYVGQAFGPMKQGQPPAFEVNAKNFLSKSRRAQIRATLEAAQVTQRSALFEFSGGKPAAEVSEFIKRNAERAGAQYQIELVE